jgi:hypothetical protein
MVSESQFLRVLAGANLVPREPPGAPPTAPKRLESFLAYYRGKGPRSHLTDYRAFLLDVYQGAGAGTGGQQ